MSYLLDLRKWVEDQRESCDSSAKCEWDRAVAANYEGRAFAFEEVRDEIDRLLKMGAEPSCSICPDFGGVEKFDA